MYITKKKRGDLPDQWQQLCPVSFAGQGNVRRELENLAALPPHPNLIRCLVYCLDGTEVAADGIVFLNLHRCWLSWFELPDMTMPPPQLSRKPL